MDENSAQSLFRKNGPTHNCNQFMSITLLISYNNAKDSIVIPSDMTVGALLDRLHTHYALNPQNTVITLNGVHLSTVPRESLLSQIFLSDNNGICFLSISCL